MLTETEIYEGRRSANAGLSTDIIQRIGEMIIAWRSFEGALTFAVAACKGVPGEGLKPGLRPISRILSEFNDCIKSGALERFQSSVSDLYEAAIDLGEYRHTVVHGRGILVRSDGSAAEYWKHGHLDKIHRRVVSLPLLDEAIGAIWIIDRGCVALERDILGHSRPQGDGFMERQSKIARARATAAQILLQTRLS